MPRDRIRRVVFLFVGLVAISLVASSCRLPRFGRPRPTASFELMSFNIRYGTAEDGLDHWSLRHGRVSEVIERGLPDVVGLQEALRFQIDAIHLAVPGYAEVGEGRDGGQEGEFSPILYRADRLRLSDSGTFWLSDTPEVPSHHWGNELNRICTWALLQDRSTGRSLYVFNTHFDHISQSSRENAAALVATRIANRKTQEPAVLIGDLNADEANPVVTYLKGDTEHLGAPTPSQLVDTYRLHHPEATSVGTLNNFLDDWDTERKIDFVFVEADALEHRTLTVDSAEILMERVDGRWPSDHFAVTAGITLGE